MQTIQSTPQNIHPLSQGLHYRQLDAMLSVQTSPLYSSPVTSAVSASKDLSSTNTTASPILRANHSPSPVIVNNLERMKNSSRFPRAVCSPSGSKINKEHNRVYTLKGEEDIDCKSPLGFSLYSNGGANNEERRLSVDELIENGLAREFVPPSILSPSQFREAWDCYYLLRNDTNKNIFHLFQEHTNEFVLSARKFEKSIYISQYQHVPEMSELGSFCAVLRPNKGIKKQFQLFSTKCEHCDGKLNKFCCSEIETYERQHLADICHSVTFIPEANVDSRVICFDIPTVGEEGDRIIWCPRAPRDCSMETRNQRLQTDFPIEAANKIPYQSRIPVWSPDAGSLVLKFQERRVRVASSKNFLVCSKNDVDDMALQFGKACTGRFNLDIKFPMSPLQAFGIALSMFLWKE